MFVYCVETVEDTAIVLWNANKKIIPKLSSVAIFNDFE